MATTINLGKYAAKFRGRLGTFKKGVIIKLFSAVIKDTPVDTGRLRANWKFAKGSSPIGTTESETDPTMVIAGQVNAAVDEKDDTYYLANNLPYANRIEYEGWSHTKAPEGMVRKNLVRIASLIRAKAQL